ncbi:sensor histidine kinase [Streptomyces xanthochromogenes]|uniref:sensor histidine kinase n=1 Tax=Streptomyces xanthochromogenes TaxID=67384 RepID=UPI00343B0582
MSIKVESLVGYAPAPDWGLMKSSSDSLRRIVRELLTAGRARPAKNRELFAGSVLFVVWGLLCTFVPPGSGTGLVNDRPVVVALGWLTSATLLLYRRHPLVPAVAATLFLLVADGRPPLEVAAAAMTCFGGRGRWGWIAVMALSYLVIGGGFLPGASADRDIANVLLANILVPALFGETLRRYRSVLAQLRTRAAMAREEVGQAADLAVIEERTRIAQHTHDVLGHKMTVLVLQAAALRMEAGRGELAERAGLVEEAARTAMSEVRTVLETLTEPAENASDFDLDRFLAGLCHNMRVTGMPLTYESDRMVHDLPSADALLLQRVAREGLTNAAKHAPGAETVMRMGVHEGRIRLEVHNGPRRGARVVRDSGGMGITALSHAFAAADGTLTAAPEPDGWFLLQATLPCRNG